MVIGKMSAVQPGGLQGPAARLLQINQKIFKLEAEYRKTKRINRTLRLASAVALTMAVGTYCSTVLTWRRVNLAPINRVTIPLTLVCIVICIVAYVTYYGNLDEESQRLRNPYEIKLDLAQVAEEKRLSAATINLDAAFYQFAYKDSIPEKVATLRRESSIYRRIHNALQGVVIIGSLMTTTLAGMAGQLADGRWYTVGSSFAVGISAGFTGYYKFREKSFYLQQTADQIEQELVAAELGIDKYEGLAGSVALATLSTRVESFVNEQKKRQQQLDQAAEKKDS